ncbi:hypothetical protein [Acinetobacter sp. GXMZU3951]
MQQALIKFRLLLCLGVDWSDLTILQVDRVWLLIKAFVNLGLEYSALFDIDINRSNALLEKSKSINSKSGWGDF